MQKETRVLGAGIVHNPGHSRLRAVSPFSWSVEQNARDTQMTTRVTEGAALVSRVSRLRRSTLARVHYLKKKRLSQSRSILSSAPRGFATRSRVVLQLVTLAIQGELASRLGE